MNTINLIGNICNDLELKQTNNGKTVMQFNLAVKRPHTKDATDFIPLVVWEKSAEFLSKYARKGSKIAISGKLTSRQFEDKNGNKRTAYEVVCDSVELCDSRSEAQPTTPTNFVPDAYQPSTFTMDQVDVDQNLPF